MKIDAAVDEFLASKRNALTKSTLRNYTFRLEAFSTWCNAQGITLLEDIGARHVNQFTDEVESTNSYTRASYVRAIKGWLFWCSRDEEMGVRDKVVRRIEPYHIEQSEIEIFTDQDILKLLKACDRLSFPHRNKALVHILLDSGIRASELGVDGTRPSETTGLLLENVVLDRGGNSYVRVMGKGRKIRTVGIGSETVLHIKRYINRERPDIECPYLFVSRMKRPLSMRMLEHVIITLGEEAGVQNCYPHKFRHTFAVRQLLAGTSDLVLMRLMGHTSLSATNIYARAMSQEQARQAAVSVVDEVRKRTRR